MSVGDVWEGRSDFKITVSKWEEDATVSFGEVEFDYANPAVSVDASGRFVKHEVIGGTTVRQKIGEDPIEVDVSGVCKESTARKLDGLRDAAYGTIISDRLPGGSLTVQYASTSTSPLSENGAVDAFDSDEFLYSFDLSCIEVQP
jgi:hypothetical protein